MQSSKRVKPTLVLVSAALWAALAVPATTLVSGAGRKFYDDDPIAREPETQDASGAEPWENNLTADLLLNLFARPGDPAENVRAQNINTIDEVPDSSWFTNRIYARPVSIAEAVRGPNAIDGPAPGRWTVIRPKSGGVAPGFTVRDSRGEVWFLAFDARGWPRAATGAIAVASRLFWALGYNQVESYLASVRREALEVAETAQVRTPSSGRRPMTMADVDRVLARAEPNPDGSYRVLAGRLIPGRILGEFRYHGTRPDDPNDIVPHEHRRELRALKVFGAWTNLVDLKAANTLDTVIFENGRGIVRHYLQDVGSTFGTGALAAREWDEGYEYLYEGDPTWKRLITLGFYRRPWQRIPYRELPEIGRFEGDAFDPEQWRSRVPVAAVLRARDDDTFWAALRVMAFNDEMIRAVVREGQYLDPEAERLLGDVLIKRRDKIGRAYLPKVNPLVDFALTGDGTLTFENAAVRAGVAAPPGGYRATWFEFDNVTGETRPLGQSSGGREGRLRAPVGLPVPPGTFVKIEVAAVDPPHDSWKQPIDVYFRRTDGWKLVGLERLP